MAKAPPREASETTEEAGEATGNAADGRKKKLILLVAIGVVLLAVSVGGTFAAMKFMGGGHKKEVAEQAGDGKGEAAKPQKAELEYLPLDPPFLSNYMIDGRTRYLQVSLVLASRDKGTLESASSNMPLIRNRFVMLLSGQQFDVLRTHAGRVALQTQLLDAVNGILKKEDDKADVEKVLFTGFVMQ